MIKSLIIFTFLLTAIFCSNKNLRSEWDPGFQRLSNSDDVGVGFLWFVLGPIIFGLSFVIVWFN